MARYIVVEFADNDDAAEFVQRLHEENANFRDMRVAFRRRVVGIFVKPGKTCECGDSGVGALGMGMANYRDPSKMKHRGVGVARGAKFGWWVCTRCNRPRAAGHGLVNQLSMSETYEGTSFNNFEFGVTNLEVSGFHTKQIARAKKLRRKKAK